MEQINVDQPIPQPSNAGLEEIRNQIQGIGELVEQQIADAVTAMVEDDTRLANLVVGNDYKVNGLELATEQQCIEFLIHQHPPTNDLRLIMAVIKTINDLGRINDEAIGLGYMVLSRTAKAGINRCYVQVEQLGNHVRGMLHDAMHAFMDSNHEEAMQIWQQELRIEKECEGITRQLITYILEDQRSIARALDIIGTVRALQRIGQRAGNICKSVINLVKGRAVRRTSLAAPIYSEVTR